jgi:hypothetical protein
MADVVLLDAGPLGIISHPRVSADAAAWLTRLVDAEVQVLVPEIADYEVRRELLRAGRWKGIERLDELQTALGFVPITSTQNPLVCRAGSVTQRRKAAKEVIRSTLLDKWLSTWDSGCWDSLRLCAFA